MSAENKTVLITGAAGFIGSHLTQYFLSHQFRVIGMDNFLTGNPANIEKFLKDPKFTLVKQDVTQYIDIKEPIHYVLHFASPASPVDYLEHPIKTLKVGSLGTHNALGLALSKKATFLLASTSEVYGDPLVHPQKEDYWGNVNPIGPRGVYDEAKRFAEALVLAYHRTHGLNVKIVRIFNTYGPQMRLRDGRAIPNFISQALKNEPITVYGDGSQTRSFCYVDDLVDGITKLLFSNYNFPVNIGNPNEMTLLELAHEILKHTGSKSKIVFKEIPVDDPRVRKPDIALAQKLLQWSPRVNLETGLKHTIQYFKKVMEYAA